MPVQQPPTLCYSMWNHIFLMLAGATKQFKRELMKMEIATKSLTSITSAVEKAKRSSWQDSADFKLLRPLNIKSA